MFLYPDIDKELLDKASADAIKAVSRNAREFIKQHGLESFRAQALELYKLEYGELSRALDRSVVLYRTYLLFNALLLAALGYCFLHQVSPLFLLVLTVAGVAANLAWSSGQRVADNAVLGKLAVCNIIDDNLALKLTEADMQAARRLMAKRRHFFAFFPALSLPDCLVFIFSALAVVVLVATLLPGLNLFC
jgi:hypothetical protein